MSGEVTYTLKGEKNKQMQKEAIDLQDEEVIIQKAQAEMPVDIEKTLTEIRDMGANLITFVENVRLALNGNITHD